MEENLTPQTKPQEFLWTVEYKWRSCPSRSSKRHVVPTLPFIPATEIPMFQIPAAPFRDKGTRYRAVADLQQTWNVIKKPIWFLRVTKRWACSVITASLSQNHTTAVRYGGNLISHIRELRKSMSLFSKPCGHPIILSLSWTKFGSITELLIVQNFFFFFFVWFPQWSKLHES